MVSVCACVYWVGWHSEVWCVVCKAVGHVLGWLQVSVRSHGLKWDRLALMGERMVEGVGEDVACAHVLCVCVCARTRFLWLVRVCCVDWLFVVCVCVGVQVLGAGLCCPPYFDP